MTAGSPGFVCAASKAVAQPASKYFFHWVLVDVPANVTRIEEGAHGEGITARGEQGPDAGGGLRHGLNSYTQWFEGDDVRKAIAGHVLGQAELMVTYAINPNAR